MRLHANTPEIIVAASILLLSIAVGVANPNYFSFANLFDLVRNATVPGILAIGVLVVLLSGGVDVSFPAVAAASSYTAILLLTAAGFQGPASIVYLVALPIGLSLGLLNAALVSRFRLPTLIVTLGTAGMIYGGVLFFVGNLTLYNLSAGLAHYRMKSLATVEDPRAGVSSLHPSILLLAALAFLVWLMLNYTMTGRSIYAMGGNREAAERAGFGVRSTEYVIYGLAGSLASVAGVTQAALYRNANPAALMGSELDVIAAVVLGGASITGGRGTVAGALLGVMLITIIKSSLVLVGIPSEWQKVATGAALILGTSVPALRAARQNRMPGAGE